MCASESRNSPPLSAPHQSGAMFEGNSPSPLAIQQDDLFFPGLSESSVCSTGSESVGASNCQAVNLCKSPPRKRGTHRRAQSEFAFRLPLQELLFDEELGTGDIELPPSCGDTGEELLSDYLQFEDGISVQGFAPVPAVSDFSTSTTGPSRHIRSSSVDEVLFQVDAAEQNRPLHSQRNRSDRPRHHYSMSMDGSTSFSAENLQMVDFDFSETKKTMESEKLAELSSLDPKRVKRILANRQSAARSKERKMRYISELEQKVQSLQTEATSLSAQLSALQRDNKGILTENSELKLRLEAMDQQAQLRDALNETLKEEVQWLKLARFQMCDGRLPMMTMLSKRNS